MPSLNSPTLIDKKELNQALMLHSKGDLFPAKALYLKLVSKYPDDPTINNYFGALHMQLRDPVSALPLLEKAARLNPGDADIFFNLGKAHADCENYKQAIASYLNALEIDPRHNRANYNVGNLYKKFREFKSALYYLEADVNIEPRHDAFCMLGEISIELNDYPQAKYYFSQALRLKPQSPLIKSKLVAVLYHLSGVASCLSLEVFAQSNKLLDEAIMDCRDEDRGTLLILKGDVHYLYGEVDEAVTYYLAAEKLSPLTANASNSLACALLSLGRFSEAWPYSQQRFNVATFDVGAVSREIASCSKPQWGGHIEAGKHLLVTSEQGIGDQLLHSGNLVTLQEAGMTVTLTCASKLVGLMGRCFPFATVLPDCVPISDHVNEQVDYQTNVVTLSSHLLREVKQIRPAKCIASIPEWRAYFENKYARFGKKLKVGIAWRSKSDSCGARKSIALEKWRPFLENESLQCISIQYGEALPDELELMQKAPFSKLYVDTEFDFYNDLDKAVAQIASLDVVVSVSNVGVHFAGQLGKPCWVLVAESTLWHWFLNTDRSPWYPSVKVARREVGQSWGELLAEVYRQFLQHYHLGVRL